MAFSLQAEEIARLQEMIFSQYLDRLQEVTPEHISLFRQRPITQYHEVSNVIDHGNTWPKSARILPREDAREIRELPFMRDLESIFGRFEISDEEEIGHEEFYWRLVRPGGKNDVAPLHADGWFWDLGHGKSPENVTRVKVWIPIYSDPSKSNLLVIPDSHKWQDVTYKGELRDGFIKPTIETVVPESDIHMLPVPSGTLVVFHDRLLHGGSLNCADLTRVSLEFTMFTQQTL